MLLNKSNHSSCVADLSIKSHAAYDIQQKVNSSLISRSTNFDDQWELQKAFTIDNKTFSREFIEKKGELQVKSSINAQSEVRYGFLATIKESMIHKVAEEGLEVRLCPYNYFGHSISGIHISQNADVCMNEARNKITTDDEIILIIFKYMLGKHKIVPMYDPDILLAPTPNYDSHLCEDRPDPTEKVGNQYIKSLVYLYEFENGNFDPTIRPRHCCPVAALVYRHARSYPIVDLTVNDPIPSYIAPIYEESPLTFLSPMPRESHWGREFLLKPPSSIVIQKNDRDDSRKVVMSEFNGSLLQSSPRPVEERLERIERWEPIRHDYGHQDIEDQRERSVQSRNGSRRSVTNERNNTEGLLSVERDRSFDRLRQWRDGGRHSDNNPPGPNSYSTGNFDIRRISNLRNWFQ